MGIFDGTEVYFNLIQFLSVCNGGRSSMNLMVSMDVSPFISGNRLCFTLMIMTLRIDRPLNSEKRLKDVESGKDESLPVTVDWMWTCSSVTIT